MNYRNSCTRATATSNDREQGCVGTSALCPFIVLPMALVPGNFCPSAAGMQQAIYTLACQQAELTVRAVRRRRQLLFARGAYRWN
jgi:hypothetical protein